MPKIVMTTGPDGKEPAARPWAITGHPDLSQRTLEFPPGEPVAVKTSDVEVLTDPANTGGRRFEVVGGAKKSKPAAKSAGKKAAAPAPASGKASSGRGSQAPAADEAASDKESSS